MLVHGVYISGKAWQIEVDKSGNDTKTLQDYNSNSLMVAKHT